MGNLRRPKPEDMAIILLIARALGVHVSLTMGQKSNNPSGRRREDFRGQTTFNVGPCSTYFPGNCVAERETHRYHTRRLNGHARRGGKP